VSEYALRVVAVLPPTVAASTLVILTPLPVITLATKLAVVVINVELTVVFPEVIKDAFTTLNTALAPPIIDDEFTVILTVVLPILSFVVSRLTLEPRLTIVVTLTVAGSLAVLSVPDVSVVALDAMTNAFEYAVAASVIALAVALATAFE